MGLYMLETGFPWASDAFCYSHNGENNHTSSCTLPGELGSPAQPSINELSAPTHLGAKHNTSTSPLISTLANLNKQFTL